MDILDYIAASIPKLKKLKILIDSEVDAEQIL